MTDTPPSSLARSPMIHGLEDRVPPGPALVVSIQQVGAMLVGTITPPLILAGILHFPPEQTAYFVSMALLASALGTLLQTTRPGFVGSGLLSVTGTSFAFLPILILCVQQGGLALAFGMALAAAPIGLLLAPALPRLQRVFTPLVSGLVVLLIGLSLLPTGLPGILAPPAPGAPAWGGIAVALLVLAIIFVTQIIGRAWARIAGLLLGVGAGYLVYAALGWLHVPPGEGMAAVTIPHPFAHGLAFRWELLLPFAFLYVVSLLESLGDMTATSHLSGLETHGPGHWARMRGGILADSLTCIASAVFGAFPSTTYAQNNGVIQITGVASRRLGPLMALLLAILGFLPPVARWITAMPPAVLGALAILLFGMVAVSGLRLILLSGLDQRDALIVALTLAVGIGLPSQHDWLATLPSGVKLFVESGVTCGGFTALLLNLILPRSASLGLRERPSFDYRSDVTQFSIEIDREEDGRWIAEVSALPGALCYGDSKDEAIRKVEALALRILAGRAESGEDAPLSFKAHLRAMPDGSDDALFERPRARSLRDL